MIGDFQSAGTTSASTILLRASPLLCRFSDAGITGLSTRRNGRVRKAPRLPVRQVCFLQPALPATLRLTLRNDVWLETPCLPRNTPRLVLGDGRAAAHKGSLESWRRYWYDLLG